MSIPPDPESTPRDPESTQPEAPTDPPKPAAPEPKEPMKSALQWLRACVIAPDPDDDNDNRFPQTQDELVTELQTDDPQRAAEILAEANEIADRMVGTQGSSNAR
jgi:hypothetical protein